MSRKYKFHDNDKLYFISFATNNCGSWDTNQGAVEDNRVSVSFENFNSALLNKIAGKVKGKYPVLLTEMKSILYWHKSKTLQLRKF